MIAAGETHRGVASPSHKGGSHCEAMVYLCSQSGRHVTGITLPVDGGLGVRK